MSGMAYSLVRGLVSAKHMKWEKRGFEFVFNSPLGVQYTIGPTVDHDGLPIPDATWYCMAGDAYNQYWHVAKGGKMQMFVAALRDYRSRIAEAIDPDEQAIEDAERGR